MLDSPTRHLDQSRLDQLKTARAAADLPFRHSLAYRLCKLCSPAVAADLALLANVAVITALAVATEIFYFGGFFPSRLKIDDYVLIGLAVGLTYFFTARFVFRLEFEAMTKGLDAGWASVKALLIAATLFLVAVFLTKTTETHSRGWFVFWIIGSGLALVALHVAYARFFATAIRLADILPPPTPTALGPYLGAAPVPPSGTLRKNLEFSVKVQILGAFSTNHRDPLSRSNGLLLAIVALTASLRLGSSDRSF